MSSDRDILEKYGVLSDDEFRALPRPEKKRYVKAVFSNPWWRLNNLYKIEDESGNVVTFKMREAQREFMRTSWYFEIILKARQLGFSTQIDIYGLDQCLFNKNYAAGIIAQDLESAGAIFATKVTFPYDNLPGWIRKRIQVKERRGGSNGGALKFTNGSRIRVATSFRSGTLQFLHISELGSICAHHPQKAREIQTGSMPTVHEGSRLFIESTAEGASGLFFELCKKAEERMIAGMPLGKKDFAFRFVPWFTHPKYKSKVPARGLITSKFFKRYFEGVEQATGYKLSDEQKQWYMETWDKYGEATKQEYPSTPREAFLTSGRRVFDSVNCMEAEGRCESPLVVYDVEPEMGKFTVANSEVETSGTDERMQQGLMNYMLVWDLPEEGREYAIGADVAEGLEHGDRGSIDVLDENGNQVAHWYGHLDTDLFAKLIAHIGKMYNMAFVMPERNNHGHAVMKTLREVYPVSRIYAEEHLDKEDEKEETSRLGWLTTKKSKPVVIEGFKEELRHGRDGIRWIGTVTEMNTYVYDAKGSTNAMEGSFDDQVMSYALAIEAVARMPRKVKTTDKRSKPKHWQTH